MLYVKMIVLKDIIMIIIITLFVLFVVKLNALKILLFHQSNFRKNTSQIMLK